MADNDVNILNGISQVINPINVKSNVKYEEIERAIVNNGAVDKHIDPADMFKEELKSLAKNLNLSLDATPKSAILSPKSAQHGKTAEFLNKHHHDDDNEFYNDDRDDDDDRSPASANTARSARSPGSVRSAKKVFGGNQDQHMFNYGPNPGSDLYNYTQEQHRHQQLSSVMNNMAPATIFNIEKEKQEDSKTNMLEQIDSLWSILEEDGADLSRIPRPTRNTPYEEVDAILKLLIHKNDRTRYCSFAEECILLGAHGLEDLFNGKRTWFGRYNPDLTNWHKQVQVKLRRMRYDTSTLVSGVMQEFNIGSGTRIILELLPNMLMHAKRRKAQFGADTIYNEQEINATINNIRNMDEGSNIYRPN
jgi:hypothetical protein